MNEKTYKVLEYNKIIELLSKQAASAMTEKVIAGLKPSVDAHEIKDMLAETSEALEVIVRKGALPLGSFYDVESSLHMSHRGGSLTMKQLLQVLYNLNVARNVVTFLKGDLPHLPIIMSLAELISIQRNLAEDIDRCILSEDEMSDNASPELKSIRRNIVRQNECIRNRMNHILNSSDNKVMLQDAIVTMRNGRYVIPVKQEHRARFPGIVHDQSNSGATLFIEPQIIVTLNNELRELEIAEKVEIQRILAELSAHVAENYHDLINNQKLLLQLDFIFAKGKLSHLMKGEEPIINDEGYLELRQARHPLIDQKKIVPISVVLGKNYKTLVITGPNTGGKTVTLKTVGLLAMMAQTGLHIPASSGSKLPVYERVFADIGDEQSIEQSLSTFSSHMKNIVDIAENTEYNTLVLLDELGAGTDPTEGAALAIAVLEYLKNRGAVTIATTHYNELKKYALSKQGVENASMEFDIETLSPTYRLSVGIPGKSNAFEISSKLGLTDKITDRAKELLERGDIEFEDVIASLTEDRKRAEAERDEAIMLNIAMKKQKEEIDKIEAKLKAQRENLIAAAKDEARNIVREAQEMSKEVALELKELARLDSLGERNKAFDQAKHKIKKADAKYRRNITVEANNNPVEAGQLKIGHRVKVLTLGQNGEVLTLPDDKEELFVQVGLLKVSVKLGDLMLINDGTKKKQVTKSSKYGSMYKEKTQSISLSINVQGQNLDNAVMDVDKYLDDAFIAGLEKVTVIHGRGEGILRSGIHDMLKKHKHVESFRKGKYNEGGDGITVVTLKK